MNHQYEYPLPPPPPTPGFNSPTGSFPQRQRPVPAQPPSIATNVARSPGLSSQTPATATTFGGGTPFQYTPTTPSALNPRTPSALAPPGPPPSATSPRSPNMEPYNPQQWSNRGQVSGSQMVFGRRAAGPSDTRHATGMEAVMASPPPPYSPATPPISGQPVQASSIVDSAGITASPMTIDHSSYPSPQGQLQAHVSPNFPPPPPTQQASSRFRDRSSSATRNFFNLGGLRGKQPANASDNQARQTIHVPDFAEFEEARPPAAKRAASTGHLQSYGVPPASTATPPPGAAGPARKESPSNSWLPGMPLPGPPPGPPPPGTRSQSLNRYTNSRSNSVGSEHSLDGPVPRRAAAASSLGPIPPTPADWVDGDVLPNRHNEAETEAPIDALQDQSQQSYPPLRIDTGSNNDAALSRRPAKRDLSAQGIRERRSRSRAAKGENDIMSPDSDMSKPNDLIFATSEGAIRRRREHMRTASGYVDSTPLGSDGLRVDRSSKLSPKPTNGTQPVVNGTTTVLTPPYTPAVGKIIEDGRKQPLKVPGSASSDRSISHTLHQPIEDSATPSLTPGRPSSSSSAKFSARLDAFALQAIERHRIFVEKEIAASSDEERLELFANFMVHESRLRRDRYATAYNAMAGDVMDLTRDMWRSYVGRSKRVVTPTTSMSSQDPTLPTSASDGQPTSAYGNMPSSASSLGDFTPATDGEGGEGMDRSDSRQWGDAFKPSLSPIPSMNVSTVPEEEDSRGRAPSRWWEKSQSGSGSIGKPGRIEKSRRETKYMGINPADLRDINEPSPPPSWHTGSTPGPSTANFSQTSEYPPEKVGWHDGGDVETPMATPARPRKVSTPGAHPLDVSRLVTLPPPYPRHHPAVNNNHPLLSNLRKEYRYLADHAKIQEIKDAYAAQEFHVQRQQAESANERRRILRSGIQEKVADGSISFAEAAQAEADFDKEEAERGKASARSNFNLFETGAAHPLNDLLTVKLQKANTCINQLQAELESRNQVPDPNQAQEEGDEEPERLEKLTLLKWMFESREQLHKEMFDLHADRSTKYSEVILTPYRIAKQQAKIDEANAFFIKDTQDRQTAFVKESLKRYEEIQRIMEVNVSRGVEDQLSAFWDIAPGLLEVIQYLPANMAELDIHIPEQEYHENPAYNDHPLQYLYSLLSHAEKSAYQFIESQTNLLCLLHEVRTATANRNLQLLEIKRKGASPNNEQLKLEMQHTRQEQEKKLTEDLKEKVGEVEGQWKDALGENLEEFRGRVKRWLEYSGGWEDGLDD